MTNPKPKTAPKEWRKPSLSATEPTVTFPAKMTASQREKVKQLGGSRWIRRMIDEAKI